MTWDLPVDDVPARRRRAADSLHGLRVGDAFGDQFFQPRNWGPIPFPGGMGAGAVSGELHAREFVDSALTPPGPWEWTDDTEMACSVVDQLHRRGEIDPDRLAKSFADRLDLRRGYGAGTVELLRAVQAGGDWRELAVGSFGGVGSMGNGAAMRTAPLGAWFADDTAAAASQARLASQVTHAHPEGVAGGVAVAVAAAVAAASATVTPRQLLDAALAHTPDGQVGDSLRQVRKLGGDVSVSHVAEVAGNGSRALAGDTVALCLWTAAWRLHDYPAAMRTVVSAGGDMDTNAAIVGGIVAAHVTASAVPAAWNRAAEPLPKWLTGTSG